MVSQKFPKLNFRSILSPMAGVTDVAFRALCKKYGVGLTCTEFVNSYAINRGNMRTFNMIKVDEVENPVSVQLFGDSVNEIIDAAKKIQDHFDIIDINCGCPAWKVIKTGAGSALLNNPLKIGELVNKLVSSVDIPVTVKIRKGIDDKNINALEVAKVIEENGASAIAIHGRTQKQGYKGKSDWDIIKKVKEIVKIPVIGNGDVFSPEIFKQKLECSKVDYIMVARGAIGKPFLFEQINNYLEKKTYNKNYSLKKIFFEYIDLAEKHDLDFKRIKQQALFFTKGVKNASYLRDRIVKFNNLEDIKKIFDRI